MHIYTLLSHEGRVLPFQIAALRTYISDLHQITVVQGPYGANPLTSAGAYRVSRESARRVGINLVEVPSEMAGLPPAYRMQQLLKWFWESYLPSAVPETSLVIHGDLFPTKPLSREVLLNESMVAGRVTETRGIWYVVGTWMISAVTKIGEFHRETTPGKMNEMSMSSWPARLIHQGDVPEMSYEDRFRFEWCEPGWLHLDKISQVGITRDLDELFDRKLQALAAWCRSRGIDPVPIAYEELHDLPNHRTRKLQPGSGVTATAASRKPDIPLAGDLIESISRRLGADRLAKLWERWTGLPCGCAERKAKLNKATERLIDWWKSKQEREAL